MKKLLFIALAAIMMASCQKEELVNPNPTPVQQIDSTRMVSVLFTNCVGGWYMVNNETKYSSTSMYSYYVESINCKIGDRIRAKGWTNSTNKAKIVLFNNIGLISIAEDSADYGADAHIDVIIK